MYKVDFVFIKGSIGAIINYFKAWEYFLFRDTTNRTGVGAKIGSNNSTKGKSTKRNNLYD